ncbi:MAG: LLM class flavin-dependent oxidoreductase [Alphaproteobacteria bacterium]|nr:LLM class flavin-dependent oxidoreductase [Alphaproteobacteria bacterium]
MQFGLNFFPCVGPDQKSAEQYFREAMHLCSLTDELGYTHIRQVEHYFKPYGGYSPNPILFLTAAAMRTRNTRLITGAVLPAFNHPLKLAGEIGMLDGISGGRLEVGFARAFLPHEFAQFEVSLDESRRRFTEGLAQIRLLLTGENVSSKGEFHSFANVTSLPRPTQAPHPPFWIAATNTPETFAFAGEQGCRVMAIPLEPTNMRALTGRYRDAWRAAGHPGNGHVMNTFFMCCMPTRQEAMDFGLPHANEHLKGLADSAKEWLTGASTKDYPGYDKLIAHVSSDTAERQMRDGTAFIGTPSEIVEMIRAYNDNVGGIDSVSLHFTPGNMPVEAAERSIRLFSKDALPKLAGL